MKLEQFVAVYEDEIVATAKTLPLLKEKISNVQVSNSYPTFEIYKINATQIDRFFNPRPHTKEELSKVEVNNNKERE